VDAVTPTREYVVSVPGGNVWCGVFGSGDAIPLLVVHGGPGFPHDYLLPLAGMAGERPVVFYDQLGAGRSDRPDDPGLWQTTRFVEELGVVRRTLGLERLHLLGHSWGSVLAAEYALSEPAGLVSLVLASPVLSVPRHLAGVAILRAGLPTEVRAVLDRHEAAGKTDSVEYEEAVRAFNRRHLCRLDPPPAPLVAAAAGAGRSVYHAMWGKNELNATGSLKDYDCTDRLPDLALPVLFTCGRHDLARPEVVAWSASVVPGAEVVVFERSTHMPHLEEPERFLEVLGEFLRRAEQG
jgi:proline iminopeptidase